MMSGPDVPATRHQPEQSDLDWDEGVRLDLYYVENWSLTGDLMLIWRTIRVVLRGDGAY